MTTASTGQMLVTGTEAHSQKLGFVQSFALVPSQVFPGGACYFNYTSQKITLSNIRNNFMIFKMPAKQVSQRTVTEKGKENFEISTVL